jgi:hypothetical protein
MHEEGTFKKLGKAALAGLIGLALIGVMALAMFGGERLLMALGVVGGH